MCSSVRAAKREALFLGVQEVEDDVLRAPLRCFAGAMRVASAQVDGGNDVGANFGDVQNAAAAAQRPRYGRAKAFRIVMFQNIPNLSSLLFRFAIKRL